MVEVEFVLVVSSSSGVDKNVVNDDIIDSSYICTSYDYDYHTLTKTIS